MEGTAHPKSRHACGRVAPWSARPRNAVPGNLGVVAGRRYYSPGLGRWTSRDPIGEDGGINLQAFVRNSALGSFDAVGLYGYNTSLTDSNDVETRFSNSRPIWRTCSGRTVRVGDIALVKAYVDANLTTPAGWVEPFITDASGAIPGGLPGGQIGELRNPTYLGAGIVMRFTPSASCCPCVHSGWQQRMVAPTPGPDYAYRETASAYDFPGTIYPPPQGARPTRMPWSSYATGKCARLSRGGTLRPSPTLTGPPRPLPQPSICSSLTSGSAFHAIGSGGAQLGQQGPRDACR